MTPRVSIIIPMYDAARYIRETVQSVLNQTYPHWDLTIVDDGSTDDSRRVVQPFCADPRVRVVAQPNQGVSSARNNGLALSDGEYVAFLDADDVWLPRNLERKVAALDGHPAWALAHSDVEIIDANARRTGRLLVGAEGQLLDALLLWEGDSIPNLPSNCLIRRSILGETGGFDPTLSTAADQDLKFRIAARHPVGRVPETLVLYRVHGANMHLNVALMERDHIRAYGNAVAFGLFRTAAFRRRCYSNLFLILAGSWWHAGSRGRALWFLTRSLATYPPHTWRAARKGLRVLAGAGSHA